MYFSIVILRFRRHLKSYIGWVLLFFLCWEELNEISTHNILWFDFTSNPSVKRYNSFCFVFTDNIWILVTKTYLPLRKEITKIDIGGGGLLKSLAGFMTLVSIILLLRIAKWFWLTIIFFVRIHCRRTELAFSDSNITIHPC